MPKAENLKQVQKAKNSFSQALQFLFFFVIVLGTLFLIAPLAKADDWVITATPDSGLGCACNGCEQAETYWSLFRNTGAFNSFDWGFPNFLPASCSFIGGTPINCAMKAICPPCPLMVGCVACLLCDCSISNVPPPLIPCGAWGRDSWGWGVVRPGYLVRFYVFPHWEGPVYDPNTHMWELVPGQRLDLNYWSGGGNVKRDGTTIYTSLSTCGMSGTPRCKFFYIYQWQCTPGCGACSASPCGAGTQTCTRADCSTYTQPCSINCPPRATNLSVDRPDYCRVNQPAVFLNWTFVDPDAGDKQSAYQVQVARSSDPNFLSPILDSCDPYPGTCLSGNSSQEYRPPVAKLSWGQVYYWRLKVWDSMDLESSWIYPPSPSPPPPAVPTSAPGDAFSLPSHGYPQIDVRPSPLRPSAKEIVTFIDNSKCYLSPGNTEHYCKDLPETAYEWHFYFLAGPPDSSDKGNATATYPATDNYNYSLKITDDIASCVKSWPLGIGAPLPLWKEISPSP